MRLNHVALVCSSEQSADDFYEGILGLTRIKSFVLSKDLARRIFGIDREYGVLVYGNDRFTAEVFLAASAPGRETSFEHICLEVKDREEFVKRCEAVHVEVNRIPKGDALLTFVKDFDGNLFEIKESSG
jgi:catechol 2,3-dioxygenase-like lactoylglutathione lyase family enzyme